MKPNNDWTDHAIILFCLGDILIERRLYLGWSVYKLAERIGVQAATVQRWEASKYERATFANILKVIEALDNK